MSFRSLIRRFLVCASAVGLSTAFASEAPADARSRTHPSHLTATSTAGQQPAATLLRTASAPDTDAGSVEAITFAQEDWITLRPTLPRIARTQLTFSNIGIGAQVAILPAAAIGGMFFAAWLGSGFGDFPEEGYAVGYGIFFGAAAAAVPLSLAAPISQLASIKQLERRGIRISRKHSVASAILAGVQAPLLTTVVLGLDGETIPVGVTVASLVGTLGIFFAEFPLMIRGHHTIRSGWRLAHRQGVAHLAPTRPKPILFPTVDIAQGTVGVGGVW